MGPNETVTGVVEQLRHELCEEFPGWRVGRGGSGRWWAVLDDKLVRAETPAELREKLRELYPVP